MTVFPNGTWSRTLSFHPRPTCELRRSRRGHQVSASVPLFDLTSSVCTEFTQGPLYNPASPPDHAVYTPRKKCPHHRRIEVEISPLAIIAIEP